MTGPLLLDTCAAIWIAGGDNLAEAAVDAIDEAFDRSDPVCVSPMTAWEVGMLISRGRLASPIGPREWFERFLATPNVALPELSVPILIDSSYLPGEPPRDPVDRIIVATARAHDMILVTRDSALLAYANEGHLHAIAC